MDLALTGFRVLVTGGSAGIGRSAAELLAAEGARVAISSRHPEEAAVRSAPRRLRLTSPLPTAALPRSRERWRLWVVWTGS